MTITNAMSGKKSDYYQTPRYAVDLLVPYIHKRFGVGAPLIKIWEPANGKGRLSARLKEQGFYTVVGTDLLDGVDFLKDNPPVNYDLIITNPPFSKKYEFIKRCYELGKPWAMIMPYSAIETPKRHKLFKDNGIQMIIPNKRVRYIPFGDDSELPSPAYLSCWFTSGLLENDVELVNMERDPV